MSGKSRSPQYTDPMPMILEDPAALRSPSRALQPRGNAAAIEALKSRSAQGTPAKASSNGVDIPAHHPVIEHAAHVLAYQSADELRSPENAAFLAEHCYGDAGLIEGRNGYEAVALRPDTTRPECAGVPPILAHRGTDDLMDGYHDLDRDGPGAEQYALNRKLITDTVGGLAPGEGDCVIQTGHSLGGANAQRATADHPDKTCELATFQAPGVNQGNAARFDHLHGPGSSNPIPVTHYTSTGDAVSANGEQHLSGRNLEVSRRVGSPLDAHRALLLNNLEDTTVQDNVTHPGLREPGMEDVRKGAWQLREGVHNRISPSRVLDPKSDPSVFGKEGHGSVIKRADALDQEVADTQISGATSGEDVVRGMEVLKEHRGRGEVEMLHSIPWGEVLKTLDAALSGGK